MWGLSKGSCIGNIFIKTNNLNTATYKLKLSITDHYPIFIAVNKMKTERHEQTFFINYNKLLNTAKSINWQEIMSIHDPNLATDKLLREIKLCIELAKTKKRKKTNW